MKLETPDPRAVIYDTIVFMCSGGTVRSVSQFFCCARAPPLHSVLQSRCIDVGCVRLYFDLDSDTFQHVRATHRHTVGCNRRILSFGRCLDHSSVRGTEVDTGSSQDVVGFLQTRLAPKTVWWFHAALDATILSCVRSSRRGLECSSS